MTEITGFDSLLQIAEQDQELEGLLKALYLLQANFDSKYCDESEDIEICSVDQLLAKITEWLGVDMRVPEIPNLNGESIRKKELQSIIYNTLKADIYNRHHNSFESENSLSQALEEYIKRESQNSITRGDEIADQHLTVNNYFHQGNRLQEISEESSPAKIDRDIETPDNSAEKNNPFETKDYLEKEISGISQPDDSHFEKNQYR